MELISPTLRFPADVTPQRGARMATGGGPPVGRLGRGAVMPKPLGSEEPRPQGRTPCALDLLLVAFTGDRVRRLRSGRNNCSRYQNNPESGLKCSAGYSMPCYKAPAYTDRHGMARIACASVSTVAKDANDVAMSLDEAPKGPKKVNVFAVFLGGLKLSALITSCAFLWHVSRWSFGFESAVVAAFNEVDIDGDGLIDPVELYAGVLLIYLRLKGLLRLKVPRQESVMRLMEMMDTDNSGDLDFEEFKRTMDMLSGQLLIRGLVQLALMILCPLLATLLVRAVACVVGTVSSKCQERLQKVASGRTLLAAVTPLVATVQRTCKKLPSSLPATVLTVVMLNLSGSWLSVVDDYLIGSLSLS